MDTSVRSARAYRFGLFEVDLNSAQLSRKGVRVRLQEQPFQILSLLLRHPGQIVTREDFRRELWAAGTYVDFDGSLNAALKRLRSALDDDPDNPRFIETIPRKGYRFIGPVEVVGAENVAAPAPQIDPVRRADAQFPVVQDRNGTTEPVPDARLVVRKYAWPIGVLAVFLLGMLAANRFSGKKREANPKDLAPDNSLSVLPFANGGAGPAFDYLRFAIASDIVTDLTYARSVSVRPFASTTKYAADPKDPLTAGREMKTSYVVSGDFVNEDGKLKVTAELTRVSDGRVLWRDSAAAAPDELVRLHENLSERLQNGVITALGGQQMVGAVPAPHSQRAYDLYLRSVAIPRDPGPNQAAIAALNESVAEDQDYAPAWVELGWRYYFDAEYAGGGEPSYKKSSEAITRAALLDPNGTANSINLNVEHGDLLEGYDKALRLLARRPDASVAHFQMAYVYRYAGLLDQAARECDSALAIDPGNFLFRSCSKVFMYEGNYPRAQVFLDLDGNSGWSVRQRMHFALRQKNLPLADALATIAVDGGYNDAQVVLTELNHESSAALQATAAKEETFAASQNDPEEKYEVAAMLSFAGQSDRAMRVLDAAIRKNYCATSLIETDPLLAPLRPRKDFSQLKALAATCQGSFMTHVKAETSAASFSTN
jgi:DNA-binding winged helix-turn-helix (wHTH) protein/TolB-like protein